MSNALGSRIESGNVTGDVLMPLASFGNTMNAVAISKDGIPTTFSYSIVGHTDGGTQVQLKNDGLNPALVFKFVKSKLAKVEVERLKEQAKKLQKFVKDTKELNQQAIHEELAKMLVGIMGVLELQACGFDKFVQEETVKKFEYKVKDRTLKFDKFENFPRMVPDRIAKKIKQIQSKNLFSEYWILYLDYTKEKVKTNKDRIREKDPILFGKIASNPDKLFYLVDWVDEYCDLTLKKFVEGVKTKNPDFEMSVLPELDAVFLDQLKQDVEARAKRLNDALPSTFRRLMTEEESANRTKKKWYKFWR